MATSTDPTTPSLHLESGVSARTGEPFVNITWGALKCQLTPVEARVFARQIMECAEAALFDAACIAFLTSPDDANVPMPEAAAFVHRLRRFRADMQDPEADAP